MSTAKTEKTKTFLLEQLTEQGVFPGYQYMVMEDGQEIYCTWGGYRDIQKGLPMERDSLFMANSSSKTITALAIMQLADRGKLDLDEDIRTYINDLYPAGKKITCRQLIFHTGGVPNPLPFKWHHILEEHRGFNRQAFEKRVLRKNLKLVSEPGHKYLYSNPGYLLLGKIVEAVSGLSFFDYTDHHVFAPLRADKYTIGFRPPPACRLVHGYQKRYGYHSFMMYLLVHGWMFKSAVGYWRCFRHMVHNSPSYGGLYSNIDGMKYFLRDMMAKSPVLLDNPTRQKMFEPQAGPCGEVFPTTHGWDHGKLAGVDYITRPGGGPGFFSNIRVYAGKKRATILFVNKSLYHARLINMVSDCLDLDWIR